MADKKQLAILKKGVKTWNKWRAKNPDAKIDLCNADLREAILRKADLGEVDLSGSNLTDAVLSEVDLSGSNLTDAVLTNAELDRANLIGADLIGADLRGSNLTDAALNDAYLTDANFGGADLVGADLIGADLVGTDLSTCTLGRTTFGEVDLSQVKGLETIIHSGPSTIGIDTIYKSKGNIPEVFLRGCGVPDNFITFMHSQTGKAFDFYPCFIGHSAKDKPFCERLYADLEAKGVRAWYFPEDTQWGETVWDEIDRGIKIYDKLVIVLSENSLQSKPMLREIQRALVREGKEHKNILFPIRIDDYIFDMWKHERKAEVIAKVVGDFSGWDKDAAKYQRAFDKLLKGLQA